ncbi:MAG: hypothetical protein AAGK22_28280 [Acidobacteriota bacterium]
MFASASPKTESSYQHFTSLSDGAFSADRNDLGRQAGPALLAVKTWAKDADEAVDIALDLAEKEGFVVTGTVRLYETPADEPPGEMARGYDMFFTSLPQQN